MQLPGHRAAAHNLRLYRLGPAPTGELDHLKQVLAAK
jgi:hypothetical protein